LLTANTFELQELNLTAMAQESNEIIQVEDGKINMSDAWQVLWWCRYFCLTKSQLETVIQAIGNRVTDIEQYFASNQIQKAAAPLAKSPIQAIHKRFF